MRCKACDVLLGDHDDPELCDECLTTIKPDFEIPPTIGYSEEMDDIDDDRDV